MSYKPRVTDEYAKRMRKWQDNVHDEFKNRKTQSTQLFGNTFTVPNGVHPLNPMSNLLGGSVLAEVTDKDTVLDMGTGCGVNAILAASKSKQVTAVDISDEAIECAKGNAKKNGVEERIVFSVSDVFDEVHGAFDIIIFDPPFRWFKPKDKYDATSTDENYETLTRFFEQANNYLKDEGRMLISFGSSGDIEYLYELIDRHGFNKEVVAHRDLEKEAIKVDYFTFKLTR